MHPKIPYTKHKSAFTPEEIQQTADKVIAGKPVSIVDALFLVEQTGILKTDPRINLTIH